MPYLTWLADTLRAANLKVVEQPGWKTRGRGEMGVLRGVLCHHTAGARTGNAPSLNLVQNGRSDLPGPLSQFVLGRDGTWYVVAAGRCNHAGAGEWRGVTAGNSSFVGVEAENMGTGADPWPEVQMDAYARGVAAILSHEKLSASMCAGHKEYATPRGRKIDPAFDMNAFRLRVNDAIVALQGEPVEHPAPTVHSTDPVRDMLQRGDTGDDVKLLQTKLGVVGPGGAGYGTFGPKTEEAVRHFQRTHMLLVDGKVGPKTWAAIG